MAIAKIMRSPNMPRSPIWDFAKEDMRIVVLQDLNLKVAHAVLVVYIDGKALVLDNQITKVVESKRIKHYKPIFSINEGAWWLHRG